MAREVDASLFTISGQLMSMGFRGIVSTGGAWKTAKKEQRFAVSDIISTPL
jgi:hypothetical protein